MVGVLERDDALLPGRLTGASQGDVAGVRAGVPDVDAPVAASRDQFEQPLGQQHGVLVHDRQTGSRLAAERLPDGVGDPGVPVSESGRRPRRREIDVLAAVEIGELRTGARTHCGRVEAEFLDAGHRGPVAADQFLVLHGSLSVPLNCSTVPPETRGAGPAR